MITAIEHVNHPTHYNQHPAGIECIDIIRHYTCDIANALKYLWRAGLKPEIGKDDAEKEIEDLKKALWYIEDYRQHFASARTKQVGRKEVKQIVAATTGHTIGEISYGYHPDIKTAIARLTCIGIVSGGAETRVIYWRGYIERATYCIQQRIDELTADAE